MQIRYAISTMVFWLRENRLSLEPECQFIKSMGFGIELRPTMKGLLECRYGRKNWARLAAATEGMRVSMCSRTDRPNLEQWQEQIKCAGFLGANIVTSLRSFGIREGGTGNYDFPAEVVRLAEENDVKLCIETGGLAEMKRLGEKFDYIEYCLDTGFANLDNEHTIREYVEELGPRVTYLHLSDNRGHIDDHEHPGIEGGILREDWDYIYETLSKYDNEVTACFEMSPPSPAIMIHNANNFLFGKLQWPNPPQSQSIRAAVRK